MSTIAAISTPNAVGGISVIRISGEDALSIAEKVFKPLSRKTVTDMDGYTCCYGKIFYFDENIDDGVLTYFKAPKSYTGEDVVEISCHGGIFVTNRVLRAVISAGAVAAGAGEFTKIAFLNGKLSLTQAEAVMDIILSQSERANKAAVLMRDGVLFTRIQIILGKIMSLLGELAAWNDYPDEDILNVSNERMIQILSEIHASLLEISKTYDAGRIIREGIETVIVGRPNVGKSTLMNKLLGYERSIVSRYAGTTRDVIEESARVGNVVLRLSDTAGIRQTEDAIESIGVSLARKKLENAELILAIFDNSEPIAPEDFALIDEIKNRNVIAVINKSDARQQLDTGLIEENFTNILQISAKEGLGMLELSNMIEHIFKIANVDFSDGIIANERQKSCVERAIASIREASLAIVVGETLDAVTILIDEAAEFLMELTGERVTDEVVNEVFSNFCVGK